KLLRRARRRVRVLVALRVDAGGPHQPLLELPVEPTPHVATSARYRARGRPVHIELAGPREDDASGCPCPVARQRLLRQRLRRVARITTAPPGPVDARPKAHLGAPASASPAGPTCFPGAAWRQAPLGLVVRPRSMEARATASRGRGAVR